MVREGQPYVVGRVDFQGADGLPGDGGARRPAGRARACAIKAAALADGLDQIERRFRRAGFLEARAAAATKVDAKEPRVDIDVLVDAGPRSVLQDVIVDGADAGKPLVARAITLTPGAPVDARALGETRRRLYDTGLYRSVAIDLQPLNPTAATTPPNTRRRRPTGDRPVAARIQLEERPGYSLRYGLAFNDEVVGPDMREQRLGFAADLDEAESLQPGNHRGLLREAAARLPGRTLLPGVGALLHAAAAVQLSSSRAAGNSPTRERLSPS